MEGQDLKIEGGNVLPFLAKKQRGLMLVEGTGTLTLHYSLDGEKWDSDTSTFDIPQGGYINIETEFIPYAYYKVTTSGALTRCRIKYE